MEQYHKGLGEMDDPRVASSATAGHSLCPAGGKLKGRNQHNGKQKAGRGHVR